MPRKYNLKNLKDIKKIDTQFLKFIGEDYSLFLEEKRLTGKPLTSNQILELAPLLEAFLIDFFQIETAEYFAKITMFQKMATVKREFVQRKVALKFKDFTGEEPDFIPEEQFTEMVLDGLKTELLTNYARFALFSENGKKLHKKGMLFKLPKKTCLPFKVLETEEILYTGEGEFKKNEQQNFGDTKYCIYCHNQQKDYCRTDNPIAKKQGCPLEQHISEMNLLKAEGGLISPLACMMIENPLCILTGDRICNDCKKACIFQKQTAVDIPSVESQILFDVLSLPFGFEIYTLLTKWNPLLTSAFLPKPYNGKRVLVCGAGPSGIANAYYFLHEGFEVVMIDGLQIENISRNETLKTFLENPIENAYTILNSDLKTRMKGGFGGVMEYGITSRFNKNLLSLCQILLERNPLFSLFGAKKFGVEITLESAKKMGFCHVLMCIGAGNPRLPDVDFSLKEGIMTASNFLMSANLQEDWKKNKILFPVVIIGGGLTAMDCAFMSKEGLSEGDVSIFVRKELETSPSFKLNEVEVEDVLFKGVKIFQNRVLTKIENNKAYFSHNKTMEEIPFKTLIFAFGTSPNNKFLPSMKSESSESEFFTNFGDLNKKYEGSVVKAIASAKYLKDALFKRLSGESFIKTEVPNFGYEVVSNIQKHGLQRLEIKAFFKLKCKPLQVFKVQTFDCNSRSIPLTLFAKSGENLIFYFHIFGEATQKLAKIKAKERISIMLASTANPPKFDRIFIDDEAFLKPLQESFDEVLLLNNFTHNSKQSTLFYVKNLANLSKIPKSKNYFVFLFNEMNCMLSGVCSRCLTQKNDGSFFYACSANILPISEVL